MYEQFFGLSERPFELTVRPRFVFLTAGHREALSTLQYGLSTRRPLTLVLGEAGTGKTTLAYAAMDDQRGHDVTPVYLSNPVLSREEFVEWLATKFELGAAAQSKTRLLADLEQSLVERSGRGNPWVLVVDEAQSLPDELLEEIRLLTNLEHGEQKLLPIVLLGQPELADRLNGHSMRQLKQRIAFRCHLRPLSARETAAYIAKRVRVAGGDGVTVFTQEAVELVYQHSGGIPRTINVICDNALVSAFAQGRRPVDRGVVEEVAADLDLAGGELAETVAQAGPLVRRVNGTPTAAPHELSGAGWPLAVTAPPPEAPAALQPGPELFASVNRRRRFLFF